MLLSPLPVVYLCLPAIPQSLYCLRFQYRCLASAPPLFSIPAILMISVFAIMKCAASMFKNYIVPSDPVNPTKRCAKGTDLVQI